MYIKKAETMERKSAKLLRFGKTLNEQKFWKLKLYESNKNIVEKHPLSTDSTKQKEENRGWITLTNGGKERE